MRVSKKTLFFSIVINVITVIIAYMIISGQQMSPSENSPANQMSRELFDYMAKNLHDTRFPGVNFYTQYTTILERMKPPAVGAVPLRPDFGDVINDVSSFRYPMRVPSCRKSANRDSVFVSIISAPGYFDKRESIRNSWISDMLKKTKEKQMDMIGYAFILGQTDNKEDQERIRKESETFGDILQIDMKDDYYNLTLKVVGLLNWLDTNCQQANFVLKVDDDVYVNARNVLKVMKSLDPEKERAYGLIKNRFIAHRGDDYFTCRFL